MEGEQKMNKVIITTDSGTDSLKHNILVPGQVMSSTGKNYRDVVEIDPDDIIARKENGEIFKTAAPLLGDYLNTFGKELDDDNDVIHLAMSSGISEGSVNGANVAANMLNDDDEYNNRVYVVDTLNGAAGGTLIVEYANYLVKQGLSAKECVDRLNKCRHLLSTSYFVPDPSGFIFSGRNKSELSLKEKATLFGVNGLNKLGMKYRVDFNSETGNLGFYTKNLYMGDVNSQMQKFIRDFINKDNLNDYDNMYFAINNMILKDVDKEAILNYIKSLNYFKEILDTNFNGVYTSYGCKDLFSVSASRKLIRK